MSTNTKVHVTNFLKQIIEADLASGKHRSIQTRFPPEPNGYLHIGHAKAICVNFSLAEEYKGKCNLRFDDTNPEKESVEFENAIKRDIEWLGFKWDGLFHASDYFEQLFQYAVKLIEQGDAYVCSLSADAVREYRGTMTEPGKNSPDRQRSITENLDLFTKMRDGVFSDGTYTLRAKIDMSHPNIVMRDPTLYRIRHVKHHRCGDKWKIYPMYDFAHCLSDAIEGVTHSNCSLEFQNNRFLYDWIIAKCQTPAVPHQYEFSRLNLNYTIMSKRFLKRLVDEKHVQGWDDPRMPTISGLRRRGYTPKALRVFSERIGLSKKDTVIDMGILEECIRDDLNTRAARTLCVLDPLKIIIENWPENEEQKITAAFSKESPGLGERSFFMTKEIYIERSDFMENPPADYHRLSPGAEVRLRYSYVIRCDKVIKNHNGEIESLICSYSPETFAGKPPADKRKVKGIIHWVSAKHNCDVEVRLYDRLFTCENPQAEKENFVNFLNPDSLKILKGAKAEPALEKSKIGELFQFERCGYFCVDPDSSPKGLIFNRSVTLKDTWQKN
ncbi:MAG: glutamine--tRNA ligase/YqeY domain fusion protein [Oligoflexales bacterium]|nr:glutamine--tRNA ligase/YqeY domain fusion protein [Oligoflexales bacterium]